MNCLLNVVLNPAYIPQRSLREFLCTAKALDQKAYPVHLKFNTGLNRLGFWENDVAYIEEVLEGNKELKITSVFSHLAASEDEAEIKFTKAQINSFEKIADEVDKALGYCPFRHILNTSGIINYPEAQFDLVRRWNWFVRLGMMRLSMRN